MKSRKEASASTSRSKKEPQDNGGNEENPLREAFLDELADVHNAEKQLTKALPKMAKAAESSELKEAFQSHLEETEGHIKRLEEVASSLEESIKRKTCKGMEGLIEEGEEIMEEFSDSEALDATLIAAAQKVEHYEIATYGTLVAWAEELGLSEAVELLQETLDEEKSADEKLTSIAEGLANARAQQ